MQSIILLAIIAPIFLNGVTSEYCYYIEAKEAKNNYLDCEIIDRSEPIEGISLIHLKHNTTIPLLKKGLISKFTNLKTLYITAANVEKIEPGALDNFKLEIVDLFHNKLKTIENGTFNALGTLKYLDLSYNQLETIDDNVFTGLVSLEWLALNSNSIKTIGAAGFKDLTKLKALYLHFNKIANLEANTFKTVGALELLDVSFNVIEEIKAGAFGNQTKLQTLLLKHNNLKTLPDNLLDNASSLTLLDISQNNFTKLQEKLFAKSENLEILKITSNNIVEFNATIFMENTPKLEEVHLFYNPWNCTILREMLEDFDKAQVNIPTQIPIYASNIRGIGCIE